MKDTTLQLIMVYGSKKKFRFSATYYNLISKDKIIWIPTRQALQTPKNYGHIRYNGFEINTNSSFFNDALTFQYFIITITH
jgi:hypothetical protein